jgi:hypothetical protein
VSRRTIFWIVALVVLAHVGAFLLIGQMRALPKARYIPPPAPPNFGYREEVETDPQTGERTITREIRVSTKLADPRLLKPKATP